MFDAARLNLAGQWHTPSLGELAELLIPYDRVEIRAPFGILEELLPIEIEDLKFFRQLVEQGKVSILIDQTPLGRSSHLQYSLRSSRLPPSTSRRSPPAPLLEQCS